MTETFLQNQLAARVQSFLNTSKQHKVEEPWCSCNTDMKSVKMQKDKILIHLMKNTYSFNEKYLFI